MPLLSEERHYTAFEVDGQLFQYKHLPFGVTNGFSGFQRSIQEFIERHRLKKVYAYLDGLTVTGETLEEHDRNLKCLLDTTAECDLTISEEKSKFRVTELVMLGYLVANKQIKPDPKRLQALLDLPEPTCAKELKRVSGLFSYYDKWIPNFSKKAGSLLHCNAFPLSNESVIAFKTLKNDLCNASLGSVQDGVPFEVGTDASDFALAAVLHKTACPDASVSRTLCACEKRYSAVEKEAIAIIEAVRKFLHFLKGRHFAIVTDQEAVSFMFSQRNRGKIKNAKILSWRLELSQLHYDIRHQPGVYNVAPVVSSRSCALTPCMPLRQFRESLGHPCFARLHHFVRQRNSPYSSEETKPVCQLRRTCAEIIFLSRFLKPPVQTLIKALRPWDSLILGFSGPVRVVCPYLLVAVDEYSRFPFVFPLKNMKLSTAFASLSSLDCVFGFPSCIHSDRGSPFVSQEKLTCNAAHGISFRKSTTNHPTGNSQCDRFNQTILANHSIVVARP